MIDILIVQYIDAGETNKSIYTTLGNPTKGNTQSLPRQYNPNPCHFFPIFKAAGQVNDNKCTNTHEPYRQKYQNDTLTTLSGIADTAGETKARSKTSYYISADLNCMPPMIQQGSDSPTNLPCPGSSQPSPRAPCVPK